MPLPVKLQPVIVLAKEPNGRIVSKLFKTHWNTIIMVSNMIAIVSMIMFLVGVVRSKPIDSLVVQSASAEDQPSFLQDVDNVIPEESAVVQAQGWWYVRVEVINGAGDILETGAIIPGPSYSLVKENGEAEAEVFFSLKSSDQYFKIGGVREGCDIVYLANGMSFGREAVRVDGAQFLMLRYYPLVFNEERVTIPVNNITYRLTIIRLYHN